MNDPRAEVLGRIRAALSADERTATETAVPRGYRASGDSGRRGAPEVVDRFCSRVEAYHARVVRVATADVGRAVASACRERGVARLAVAPGVRVDAAGVELLVDEPVLAIDELDAVDGVLTGCALAIAETGTIVLDGGARSGRRALTLVPDYHLCIVEIGAVVAGVPDAVAALGVAARDGRPITLVSGPSATSDIELDRVEGVHGPRTLDVLVVG